MDCRRRPPAAVAELNGGHRTERLDEVVDATVVRNVAVLVDAGAMMGLPAARFDGGLLADARRDEMKDLHELRKEGENHEIEKVGARLRALLPWPQEGRLVDRARN